MSARRPSAPQAVVIFGASGDLTKRKLLPAFFHLFVEGMLPEEFAVIGYARTQMDGAEFVEYARDGVKQFGRTDPSGDAWESFAKRLSYLPGEFGSRAVMGHLRDHLESVESGLGEGAQRFFYCATPASVYPLVVKGLGEMDLGEGAKIVIEKPFGHDLPSARRLNQTLHAVFDESQIFRIDHYLGKETVQNILAFRFASGIFEPIWNRRYVDNVQITVAEDIGIEGRGAFYEATGAVRDMVQTHLFQTLTFLAMEPPVSMEPDRLRDEKVKVLRAMSVCQPSSIVRGQYSGYRAEPGVAADSDVATFAALELEIDNWRWAGVPFYLRTGKELARKTSEISLQFRGVPYDVFRGMDVRSPGRDTLTLRVQPNEGITLAINVKRPGQGLQLDRATMDFDYEDAFHTELLEAYEILLLEAMEGDHTLFIREDEAERAWEVLAAVLDHPPAVVEYEPGTWGPKEADALIAPRHWRVGSG